MSRQTDWRDILPGWIPPERRFNSVVHTTEKEERQTNEPRHHDHARPYDRSAQRFELTEALDEWAADYENLHSVFED